MRKAARIISLLLALLLISVGCFGALAQEPAAPEGEMIVQDNAAREASEREAGEQTGQETDEPEVAEKVAQETNEQESVDQAAAEKEEVLNEVPTEIPSESNKAENTEDQAEGQPVVETPKEAEKQEAINTDMEDPFTANVSIELTNTENIHLGDELQLKAVVDGANRSYAISWQNREQPASADRDPDWVQIETGETYQLSLTEETAGLEYRVLLTADNDQTVASGEFRLPEPIRNDERSVETNPDAGSVPNEEEDAPTAEGTENAASSEVRPKNADQEESVEQEDEEELVVIPEASPEYTDEPDGEERDLDLAWNEIIVVTETSPETEPIQDVSEQSGGEPEVTDDENGESQTLIVEEKEPEAPVDSEGPQASDEDVASDAVGENGEGQETPEADSEEPKAQDETGEDFQTPVENEEEPAAPMAEELQKERKVRVLSSRGETIVCGETIRMAVDLSDFEDCAQVSVVWEADKGSGWEEVGTGDRFEYTASAESILWQIRARVRYMP